VTDTVVAGKAAERLTQIPSPRIVFMIRSLFTRSILVLITLGPLGAVGAVAAVQTDAHRQPRITGPVVETQRKQVAGSMPRVLSAVQDLGKLDGKTVLQNLQLVLKASPAQEHALQTLLDQQQDRGTANFHRWMTPSDFGNTFGVDDADLAKLTGWLQSHGMTVEHVTHGKRAIVFSATSSEVESAFQTEMHRVMLRGEKHVINTTPVSVPAAFGDVVEGVYRLNDIRPRQPRTDPIAVTRGADGWWHPILPAWSDGGSHYMSPGDFAKIYNTQPLLDKGIDGTGVTIGIVGWSDVPLRDIQTFRSAFGLKNNDPQLVSYGADPGINDYGEGEAELDTEWSGAAAPGATVVLVNAPSTVTSVFLYSALEYLVDNNAADVISASVADCEADTGNFLQQYYEQAAAQGISVFASASDAGSAGCDDFDAGTPAMYGYAVNGWSSTPYNTSVGGNMFLDTTGNWWGTTNSANSVSALGYIPEGIWNESGAGTNYLGGIWAGSGGVSDTFAKPTWQTGPGVPTTDPISVTSSVPGPHRYIPDVALTAAVHDGYLTCFDDGSCQVNSDGTLYGADVSGGTSASSPAYAGIQALIDQKYGRQGVINYTLYQLAAGQSASACNSSGPPGSNCIFNDVTPGTFYLTPDDPIAINSNGVPCDPGSPNCPTTAPYVLPEFPTTTAYDLATGLGSVNAANLFNAWNTVTFHSTVSTLAITPTSSEHGSAVTATIQVAPGSGSGTPTGDVALMAVTSSGATIGVGLATPLVSGSVSVPLSTLPAGTYQIYARYGGDDTYGASSSNLVSMTIGSESSKTTLQSLIIFDGNYASGGTSFQYGTVLYLDVTVAGTSGNGAPTGTVTLKNGNSTIATQTIVSTNSSPASLATGSDTIFMIGQNVSLPVGMDTLTAVYNGDSSFGSSSSTITYSITKATSDTVVTSSSGISVSSGQSVALTATVAAAGSTLPTGTVQFYYGTTAIGSSVSLVGVNGGAVATTAWTASGSGAQTITAKYAGDLNYAASTSPAVHLTVTTGATASSTTLQSSAPATTYGSSITLTLAVTPSAAGGAADIYQDGALLATASVTSGAASYRFQPNGGSHKYQAIYRGNSTYAGSSSSSVNVKVNPATTTSGLNATVSYPYLGQSVGFTIFVSFKGTAYPTGTVKFYDGSTNIGSVALNSNLSGYGRGYATFLTTLLATGVHSITATYAGDSNYAASTTAAISVTVGSAKTSAVLVATPNPVNQNKSVVVTATVRSMAGNNVPTGKVIFFALGRELAAVTLNNGAAALSVSTAGIPVGNYVVSAAYSGDASNAASNAENLTVAVLPAQIATTATTLTALPTIPTVGENVTLTARVTETNGTGTPTGTVTFLYGSHVLSTTALSNGLATFTASTATLAAGSYNVTARYNGDTVDTGSTSTSVTVPLSKASTVTSVIASPSPAALGASVTLTATVTRSAGSGGPTGTVTFSAAGRNLGRVTLSNATATLTASTTGVPTGSYVVTVAYSGDAGDAASSGTVSETIE